MRRLKRFLFGEKDEKPLFWKYDAKYVGGHVAFSKETRGKLYLYPEPLYKVSFESKKVNIEIPLSNILDSKIVSMDNWNPPPITPIPVPGISVKRMMKPWKRFMLAISFKDQLGHEQSPMFELWYNLDGAASKLNDLRMELQSKS